MRRSTCSSLWFKLVGVFAAVTLLTLAGSLVIFFVISQGELARFLEQNSTSIQQILHGTQIANQEPIKIVTPEPGTEGIVEITVPLETALQESTARGGNQFLDNIQRALLLVIGFTTLLTIVAGTFLFRQITRPLARLETAALAIGDGQLDVRVPVTTIDEVGLVGKSFNQMADKLKVQEQIKRQMIADIAHELRTPLTVIQSNLEAMIDGLISPEEHELVEVHGEVLRLIRLTDSLRFLSLADAGQLQVKKDKVDIGGLIESVLHHLAPSAQEQGILLEGDYRAGSISVIGDEDKLRQALINLVDNGIRYSPTDGRVVIRAEQTRDTCHIHVTDNGPGIPPQDQPFIFERFWRGDQSRNRSTAGSGLGLAISKEIILLHGGSISVSSPQSGGTKFTISIPRR
ncbi:MAG: HAMP domain-containing protein [Chloroflexota bacterium]|nr:MAG: HAMP domain-containing protein [Chloroflexota bacterium]